ANFNLLRTSKGGVQWPSRDFGLLQRFDAAHACKFRKNGESIISAVALSKDETATACNDHRNRRAKISESGSIHGYNVLTTEPVALSGILRGQPIRPTGVRIGEIISIKQSSIAMLDLRFELTRICFSNNRRLQLGSAITRPGPNMEMTPDGNAEL